MADTTPTSNMGLQLPIPTVTLGPEWAFDVNAAFEVVDEHDHSPGKGVPVTPDGMNITTDLPFNSNNALLLRSSRYVSQPSALSSPDIGCVYVAGGELYYNDLVGNMVQITANGAVTGAAGTITGLPSGTASAAYVSATGTFVFEQSTSTAANLDIGTIVLRYPGSYPNPTGNAIVIEAPNTLSTLYRMILPATLPSATGLLSEQTSGQVSYTYPDNSTLQISGTTLLVPTGGITSTQLAANSVTTVKIADNNVTTAKIADSNVTQSKLYTRAYGNPAGAGDVLITANCGTFHGTSTTVIPITNFSGNLTCTGRPVFIAIIEGGNTSTPNAAYFSYTAGASGVSFNIILRRDGTNIGVNLVGPITWGPLHFFDTPAAGIHSYQMFAQGSNGSADYFINNMRFIAYELN